MSGATASFVPSRPRRLVPATPEVLLRGPVARYRAGELVESAAPPPRVVRALPQSTGRSR